MLFVIFKKKKKGTIGRINNLVLLRVNIYFLNTTLADDHLIPSTLLTLPGQSYKSDAYS